MVTHWRPGHAHGLRVVDGDPLASLEARVRRRLRDGNVVVGAPSDLGVGRTYLVTGCAGFIGSHLVEALCLRGCSVIGVDAFIDNYSRAAKERNLEECRRLGDVRFAELDLAVEPVAPLMEHVDGVFHLAARPGVRTSWGPGFGGYLRDNLQASQHIFEAAARQHKRVVYASSSSVYGDTDTYPLREGARLVPVSPYGVSKLACEALAGAFRQSRGLDAVGLRYFSVYGPRQRPDMAFSRVFGCLAEDRPFGLLGGGRQTRDFTFVGDVVAATLAAMKRARAGRVYNVGGGDEISLQDAVRLCERIAGRRLQCRDVPPIPGDARRTAADVGRARAELGWRPMTSLEDGLRAQAHAALGLVAEPAPAWSAAAA
jgi:nucleoside-diphosphate-sugar epimerase